jgi:hypothetical protein
MWATKLWIESARGIGEMESKHDTTHTCSLIAAKQQLWPL